MKILELLEGGNVFAGRTGSIKSEDIDPTLDAYFAELKSIFPNKAGIFDQQHFILLGSAKKKPSSGDIDLGISASDIIDKSMSDEAIAEWGVDPKEVKADAELLQKRARTATPEQLRMKAFLRMLSRYINKNAPTLHCDETKVSAGNLFCLYPQIDSNGESLGTGVQIDWMIGDLNWLKFSYHSSAYPAGSNIKGLHRTQLMLAAFQVANLLFQHAFGVKDKATGKLIATDPDSALDVLNQRLGTNITRADVEDYYKLHQILKSQLSRDQYNALVDIYLKILDSTRADIPDDLQDEWRNRKDRLGLTGKFLPDTSRLRGAA